MPAFQVQGQQGYRDKSERKMKDKELSVSIGEG